MSAPDSLTAALCTECGLCCDGSLLAEVELSGEVEAGRMETLDLEVEEGDDSGRDAWFLPLPCEALCGSKCGIYEHRPRTCRTFECRLLKDADSGALQLDEALGVVAAARSERDAVLELLNDLDAGGSAPRLPLAERVSETVLQLEEAGRRSRKADRLRQRMESLGALLTDRFLGE